MAWRICDVPSRIPVISGISEALAPPQLDRSQLSAQQGRTLLEMLIVVAIIGIAAAVAVPSTSPTHQHRLGLAGSQVADAFRFAREEARRTGVVHGVSTDVSNNNVRVFRLDEGPNPNLKVYDVRHPVTKQLYAVQIGASPYAGVGLDSYGGQMVGTCNDPGNIAFDSNGVVRCVEPTTTRIDSATVNLAAGQLLLTVAIDSYTGRVSVQ